MLGPFHSSGPSINALPAALPVDYPQEWIPGGRLSLSNSNPVDISDRTGASTLYYDQYVHNRIPIFDGAKLKLYPFQDAPSLSLSLTSAKNYDVFAIWDGYRLQLSLGAAWTNATTRANALTTLPDQHGRIKVNSVAIVGASPYCATWLGIIRASNTNAVDDTVTKRFVCNAYNRVMRRMFTCPGYTDDNAATTYTSTSTSWAAANGGTGSQLAFLGLAGDVVLCLAHSQSTHSGATSRQTSVSDLDSTTDAMFQAITPAATAVNSVAGKHSHVITSDSYHTVDLLIKTGGATATWSADVARGGAVADPPATFLCAEVWG